MYKVFERIIFGKYLLSINNFTKFKFLTNQFYFQSEEKFEVRRCVEEAAIVVTSDAEIKASCTITLTSPVMRETATPEGGKDKY